MSRTVSVCSWAIALGLLTQCAARPTGADGAATPEDAVAAYNASVHAHDAEGVARLMTPDSRRELVIDVLSEITTVIRAVNPEAAPQGPRFASRDRKHYRTAVDRTTQVLKPFGLEWVVTSDQKAIAGDPRVQSALAHADTVALIATLFKALPIIGSELFDADPQDPAMHDIPIALTTTISVADDAGSAAAGAEVVRFERIDGRWYIAHSPVWYLPHMPRGA